MGRLERLFFFDQSPRPAFVGGTGEIGIKKEIIFAIFLLTLVGMQALFDLFLFAPRCGSIDHQAAW